MTVPGEDCRVCGARCRYLWSTTLLQRQVRYFECDRCRYLQTEAPWWLDEAYSVSINHSDTGILTRNQECVERVLVTLWLMGGLDQRVVDVAGGYGILVRLLRDAGVDAYWSDKYTQNLVARGFEDPGGPSFLATSFEAFEHFVHPVDELRQLLDQAGSVLCSTQLAPLLTPAAVDWWYYGVEHGQHVGFFRRETLAYLSATLGVRVLSDGRAFHLFTRARTSELLWRQAMKHRRHLVRLARSHLVSRTQSDHEALARSPGPTAP
jgi:hypothetical protein